MVDEKTDAFPLRIEQQRPLDFFFTGCPIVQVILAEKIGRKTFRRGLYALMNELTTEYRCIQKLGVAKPVFGLCVSLLVVGL